MKKTLGNFFPFTLGTGTGDEVETQEEEEDDDEHDDFGSQLSLNSSTHENGAPTNRETGSSDRLGVVKTKNKTIDASQQSREFVTMANSEVQPVKTGTQGQATHQGNQKRIIKKHRERDVRLDSRLALIFLEPIG